MTYYIIANSKNKCLKINGAVELTKYAGTHISLFLRKKWYSSSISFVSKIYLGHKPAEIGMIWHILMEDEIQSDIALLRLKKLHI